MLAVWDWHMPRKTEDDERVLVNLAAEIGFDTLIIHEPTQSLRKAAHRLGMKVLAIVTPNVTEVYAAKHPDAVQHMLPAEDAIAAAVRELDWEEYATQAHRWFPIVQMGGLFCFESPAGQKELTDRVTQALRFADGVAFDGFGFRNHYACFCEHCTAKRETAASTDREQYPAKLLAKLSEQSLVAISQILFDHAKAIEPQAVLTNHVWPPFRPNPYYANRLRLDYCSQTISWFYHPVWSLERVAFEARHMKALEDRSCNRFVPFIGLFDDPALVRSPRRIQAEMAIALEYGGGSLVFCSLRSLHRYPEIRDVVKRGIRSVRYRTVDGG